MRAVRHTDAGPLPAFRVGPPNAPEIVALLAQLDAALADAGVKFLTARELCRQRQSIPGRPAGTIMIPPPVYTPYLVDLGVHAWNPIRLRAARPINVISGYRDPVYNTAIRDDKKPTMSRHQFADAIDISPVGWSLDECKLLCAEYFLTNGKADRVGFGVYPSWCHVDVGYRQRTWNKATAEWLERARRVS